MESMLTKRRTTDDFPTAASPGKQMLHVSLALVNPARLKREKACQARRDHDPSGAQGSQAAAHSASGLT